MLSDLKADSRNFGLSAARGINHQCRYRSQSDIGVGAYTDSIIHQSRMCWGPTNAAGDDSLRPSQPSLQPQSQDAVHPYNQASNGVYPHSQVTNDVTSNQQSPSASSPSHQPYPNEQPQQQQQQQERSLTTSSQQSTPSPGYWLASDGKCYPNAASSTHRTTYDNQPPAISTSSVPPGQYLASDGHYYPQH
jgi:hypothetical protein